MKFIYRCKECGFEFVAFDDIDTVHESLTGHKDYEKTGEVNLFTPVIWIVEAGKSIEIPWRPK